MDSEWVTVKNKKKSRSSKNNFSKKEIDKKEITKKNISKRVSLNYNIDPKKVYFLPSEILKNINFLFNHGYQAYDFMNELVKICNPKQSNWNNCIVYVLHEASSRDKLELMEFILNLTPDRTNISNSKCGPLEFTPIFRSSYNGSIRALKMLLCAGADPHIKNKFGETVIQALEKGKSDTNNKSPENKIFTDEKYYECTLFLQNWNPNRERIPQSADFKAYIPPNMREEKVENNAILDESFENYSINDFLENIQNAENVKVFFKKKNSHDIVNTIIIATEKGIQYFERFIKHINILNKEKVVMALTNNDLIEYINFDAPFAKDKLNLICEKLEIPNF